MAGGGGDVVCCGVKKEYNQRMRYAECLYLQGKRLVGLLFHHLTGCIAFNYLEKLGQ